ITAAGQTWEIDEPGWVDGDIYEHLQDTVAAGSFLDDGIGISTHGNTIFPDDVSMALGWDFILGSGESANISFVLSDTVVPSGFYLAHNDPDSLATIYFSSTLEIGADNPVVPEPSTVILLGIGMAGLVATRKRLGKRFIKG
ncbi:MAG: PEP-CTERM sorting domain-containing protein, partial [Candidatus Scalindua rubra]|nr:PEP-CTERM sorting domain-containing protein [Candidatus Scalindua rubra]